jgi:hypothetical protein
MRSGRCLVDMVFWGEWDLNIDGLRCAPALEWNSGLIAEVPKGLKP